MIDVLVEASSPDLYAQIADLLRDHPQLRVIERDPDTASPDESRARPDVVIEALDADDAAAESFASNSFGWNTSGWNAAGVPVILLVQNPARRLSEPLPPGVRAVLPRNITPAEIAGAIEAVAAGLYVFHPSELDFIAALRARDAERAPEPSPEFGAHRGEPLVESLTPREIEVLQLLAEGLGNKEIASRLNISEHTAKFHVASIMGKLDAASRTEAVTLGIRHGLVMI
jgi:NarL family two-component system response regulator YdfI